MKLIYGTAWKKERTAELVELALKTGFKGVDTACQPKHYNEPGVGEGIANSGIKREDLFLQTKFTSIAGQDPETIPYDPSAPLEAQIKKSLETSLVNLKTDYLDSLVMHSLMNSFEETLEGWKVMESFVRDGKVRQLGISNCYDDEYFKALYEKTELKPAVLQNRFYADSGYDVELRAFCKDKGITYQSFWTLSANPHILEGQTVMDLAKKYGTTPAVILYRCLSETGVVPLCGTKSEVHMKEDLALYDFEISADEVSRVIPS
ncbi:MAG: aldo/keto reductase [Halobacteriovorax sp.]|nr:aldo/keto reductase [Halobacteriovorax sp.]|tara:strand:+ start:6662 stop:7450 length:789 start_codon:yes stop_codon:yes gene_type:complete